MEPFGLFSLFQSLLSDARTENAAIPDDPSEKINVGTTQPPSKEKQDKADPTSPVTDAFLFFMETHDARAKKIKSDKS